MRLAEEQRIDSSPAGKRFAAAAEIARRIRPEAIARGEAVKEEEDEDGLDDVDVEKEEDEDK